MSSYLEQITGLPRPAAKPRRAGGVRVAIGTAAARSLGVEPGALDDLRDDGFVIRSFEQRGGTVLAVAGRDPHGTNIGVATLLQLIRADGRLAYVDAPVDRRESPSLRRARHSSQWLAVELSLCVPRLEGGGLEALRRHRVGAAHQPLLSVALHGDPAGASVVGRRGIPAGGPPRHGLRAAAARHGRVDHAVGQPDRRRAIAACAIRACVRTGSTTARRT